jgi:hypothetical protein
MSAGEYPTGPITIRRQASDEGDDTGTFGLAFKHYADWLGEGTDLGLYFVRQSLTAPVGTFTLNDMVNATTGNAGLDAALAASGGNVNNFCNIVAGAPIDFATCNSTFVAPGVSIFQAGFGAAAGTKRYLTQYVNDVDSFGFSFNTTVPLLGGSALSGELNYTPDMPFALNDVNINCHDLNAAGVGDYIAGLPVGSNLVDACQAGAVAPTGPGATIQGYQFEKSLTGQVGMISTLSASDPMVALTGGDLMVLIFNAGFQYIPSLDNATNRYAVPRSASVNPNPIANAVLGNAGCQVPGSCVPQYADSFSSGYRIATSVDYNNAFGTAWTLSPSIQWAHDVTGYSAGPVGPGFVEGRKTVSVGVTANLRGVWRANLQYTNSFGNAYRNFGADKDFVTATVSYAF